MSHRLSQRAIRALIAGADAPAVRQTPNEARTEALIVTGETPTVARLMDAFFSGRSEHTLRSYRLDLEKFTRFLCRVFAKELSQERAFDLFLRAGSGTANEIVLRFRTDLQAQNFAPATINRHLASIRSLVKLARLIGIVTWAIEIEGVKSEPARDTRGPSVDVIARMLAITPDDAAGARDHAMIRVLFDLALRVGEVARLNVEDYEPQTGSLWILGKGRKQKEVLTLAPVTRAAIDRWLTHRTQQPRSPLFVSLAYTSASRDHRLTTRGIHRIIRSYGAKVGVRVWPHALRHSGITRAVIEARQHDIGIEEVRQFSRHKGIGTLLIYRDRTRNVQGQLTTLVSASTEPPTDDTIKPEKDRP